MTTKQRVVDSFAPYPTGPWPLPGDTFEKHNGKKIRILKHYLNHDGFEVIDYRYVGSSKVKQKFIDQIIEDIETPLYKGPRYFKIKQGSLNSPDFG